MARECIPTPVVGHGLIYATSGPNSSTYAVRPGGRGDVTESHVVWSSSRGNPFVPSAILVGDYYYLVDDHGIGTCLAAATGKTVWKKRFGGEFTASPVAAEGRVYFTSEAGTTLVLRAGGEKYEELARNTIDEPVFASAAISHGQFFLRAPGTCGAWAEAVRMASHRQLSHHRGERSAPHPGPLPRGEREKERRIKARQRL